LRIRARGGGLEERRLWIKDWGGRLEGLGGGPEEMRLRIRARGGGLEEMGLWIRERGEWLEGLRVGLEEKGPWRIGDGLEFGEL
jgi:hypothetical protein